MSQALQRTAFSPKLPDHGPGAAARGSRSSRTSASPPPSAAVYEMEIVLCSPSNGEWNDFWNFHAVTQKNERLCGKIREAG